MMTRMADVVQEDVTNEDDVDFHFLDIADAYPYWPAAGDDRQPLHHLLWRAAIIVCAGSSCSFSRYSAGRVHLAG